MGNCLVTKLKDVVDNDMLVHFGNEQLVIDDWEEWSGGVTTDNSGKTFTFKIKSNHEFTDSTHQQHLGKEITITAANTRTVMYFNALDGESGPVIVELGPKNMIVALEGGYPLNDDSYGYTGLNYIRCTCNVLLEKFAKLFPSVRAFQPTNSISGDIIRIAEWDSLIGATQNNKLTGVLENFLVAKYNRPQSVQMKGPNRFFTITGTGIDVCPTFNGVAYPTQEVFAKYSDTAPYITVKLGGESGTLLGSWDGTSWTYTN